MKNHVVSIYRQAERFAEITQRSLITGNIPRARKCLEIAEKLLKTGSDETKNVITGIYLHSVSSFMEIRHCSISGLFPQALKAAYVKQVNASGV